MPNPVMQWQIVASDPEGLARFYRNVFGWQVDAGNALGYRVVATGSDRGINGGIWPAPADGRNLVQLFIEVEDIDLYIAKATRYGATVIVPNSELPDGDAMAIVRDPAGLSFGLYRPRSAA